MIIDSVLKDFGINKDEVSISAIHQGLINNTWKIGINGKAFILQRVNNNVFKHPEDIAFNISEISNYLQKINSGYYFVSPVKTFDGKELVCNNEYGYFRAFPFVSDSHSIDVVQTPEQAYEAAKQFGKFTSALNGFDTDKLKITIPRFHDLSLRYELFETALSTGSNQRIKEADSLIKQLKTWSNIAETYEDIKKNSGFHLRVTHHDAKISNVLFDKNDKGICVIDLDTVMPGYFISDVGDMMRTYLCPVSEEERDFSKIEIREEFYEAIVDGYLSEMENELTTTEKGYFFYAGTFVIYMQTLRFLTDYINNDVYYGAQYPKHNFNRAKNQAQLLSCLLQKRGVLENLSMVK